MDKATLYNILKANCRTNDGSKWAGTKFKKEYLEKLGIYDELMNLYPDSSCLHETLYRLENNIDVRPVCKICGKPVNYRKLLRFTTYCSRACSNLDPEVLAKNKAGVSKALKKAYAERGDEINRKRAKTLTGDENGTCTPFGVKKWQEKAKATIMERYGVDNVFRLKEKRMSCERWRERCRQLWASRGIDVEYVGDQAIVHNACEKHPDITLPIKALHARIKRCPKLGENKWDIRFLCRECHPIYKTNIERWCSDVLERLGLSYEFRSHQVIKPYELDFYIPEKNFAIETNGVYWHNVDNGDYETVMSKYRLCHENKIQFVTLWEDDILHHAGIMEALLKSWIMGFSSEYFSGLDIQEIKQTSVALLRSEYDTVHIDCTGVWIEGKEINQPVVMRDAMWMIDEPMLCNSEIMMLDPEKVSLYTTIHNADGQDEECVHQGFVVWEPGVSEVNG